MTSLGQYELREQVGEGGMGQVWSAWDRVLGRDVAIKLITSERTAEPQYRRRFRAEVQSMARLDHPGIVEVFDYDSLDAVAAAALGTTIGAPYYVMELAGRTLPDAPPRDWPGVLAMLGEVLDALAHSHSRGVIHRDLKPGNMLVFEGAVRYKLADFGIAYHSHHWSRDPDLERERDDGPVGSPYYMAPEQWLGLWRDFGPWSDLYALAGIAYELLCGQRAFAGESLMELAVAHTSDERPKFEPRVPVPEGLQEWFRLMLARDPMRRFRRAADAAWALSRLPPAPGEATLPFFSVLDAQTVVVPTATVPLDDLIDVHLTQAPAGELETAPMVPGLAEDWRSRERGPRPRRQGLGLFGLRAPAIVDRDAERDVLWTALREAASKGRPQGVVLEGPAGIGKSRLAEWVCQRAEEIGGTKSLHVAHAPGGQFEDGIGPMLDTAFATHGLVGSELLDRVESALRAASPSRAYADVLAADGDIVAELIRPSESGIELTRAQRNATLMRLLKAIGARRALIFWVDDAQWALDTLSLAEALLQHTRRLPILVVLTVRADRRVWSSNVDDLLERIRALDNVYWRHLEALPPGDQRALIDDLIMLDDDLAERLTAHTDGAPLFAVQTLQGWVESRALRRIGEVHVLDEHRRLPSDVVDACSQRVEHLIDRFGDDEQPAIRAALEYAAALGEHVDENEWITLCEERHLAVCSRLLDTMLLMGIARPHEGAWSFAHHTFRDVIDARTTAARRRAVQAHWANFLDAHHERSRYGIPGRLAQHWLAAEEPEQALEPLLEAARQHYTRAEFIEALAALDTRWAAMDALNVHEDDRRKVENRVTKLWYQLNRGEVPEQAHVWLPIGERIAVEHGWYALAARQAHLRGYLGLLDGDEALAEEHFERATEYGGRGDDLTIAGHATRLRGYVRLKNGDFEHARALANEALAMFEELDDPGGIAETRRTIATIALGADDPATAETQLRTGLRELLGTGYRDQRATLLSDLGELECRLGRFDRAELTLREAMTLFRHSGMPTFIAGGNLGLALLAAGKLDEACRRLDDAATAAAEARLPKVAMTFRIGHDACNIAMGEAPDEGLHARLADVASRPVYDHHVSWALELLAETAGRQGHEALAAEVRRTRDSSLTAERE